jgi:hypothetical protein
MTVLFAVSVCGQTFSGIQTDGNCNFEFQFKINSDSTFICTRSIKNSIIENKKKKKRKKIIEITENNCSLQQLDTFAYYTGKVKRINDTITFLRLNNTYALSFFVSEYGSYKNFDDQKKDSILISYDSIRFNISTKFRLLYENKIDTVYKLSTLFPPKYQKYYNIPDTAREMCHPFYFPINHNYLDNSNFLNFDIGLVYPCSRQPILFKVPKEKYPTFKNWSAPEFVILLVETNNYCYIELWEHSQDMHSSEEYIHRIFVGNGQKIQMKKNCN